MLHIVQIYAVISAFKLGTIEHQSNKCLRTTNGNITISFVISFIHLECTVILYNCTLNFHLQVLSENKLLLMASRKTLVKTVQKQAVKKKRVS